MFSTQDSPVSSGNSYSNHPQVAHWYRLFVGWVPRHYAEANLKPIFDRVSWDGWENLALFVAVVGTCLDWSYGHGRNGVQGSAVALSYVLGGVRKWFECACL